MSHSYGFAIESKLALGRRMTEPEAVSPVIGGVVPFRIWRDALSGPNLRASSAALIVLERIQLFCEVLAWGNVSDWHSVPLMIVDNFHVLDRARRRWATRNRCVPLNR